MRQQNTMAWVKRQSTDHLGAERNKPVPWIPMASPAVTMEPPWSPTESPWSPMRSSWSLHEVSAESPWSSTKPLHVSDYDEFMENDGRHKHVKESTV